MYVPKAKREYGYYVLPILRGDRIVGRIEPAYRPKGRGLAVKGVFAEPDAPEVPARHRSRHEEPGEVARSKRDLLHAARARRLARQPCVTRI